MNEGNVQLDASSIGQTRSLFKPGSWLSKIDFINHLILFNNVLMTVLAEKDGGKTSFSQVLQSNLDKQIKPIIITITPPFDGRAVAHEIATQLHLRLDSDTNIISIADQINERKAHVLIVIDDAHHVSESFIKEAMIAIKNQNEFGFFHLCLLSDYSLVAALNALAVDQFDNLIHSIELGALNESETRTYVLQRAMSTRLINKPLTDAQYKQFYQSTKGNLSKINSDLEEFITKSFSNSERKKSLKPKLAATALSVLLLAGLSYVYYDRLYKAPSITDLVTANSPEVIETKSTASQSIPSVSYIASWQDSSVRQLIEYALPKKQILDDFSEEREEIKHVAVVDKVVVIPTVKPQTPPANVNMVLSKPTAFKSELPKIPLASPKQYAAKAQSKAIGKSVYTIQLVASHRVSDVQRFRKSSQLLTKAKVRHFKNDKGTWYVLTLGEFDNRIIAQSNIKKLPPELAKLNPWIRSVSGLANIG
ncbi:AAA family ATPase [Legionella waltersii]|uniref:DamX-related protein n=1 Tax=Legionella waltersii TaxID=66969 RepID=A0A0W1ANM8_9GAMM|nr:AAA family ATPase [Legionella waltersii]KTD82927.1 DamX-related protein [Legionella waltersii]SNV02342.1 DamX-like protein [Legionella waltersii]